MKRALISVYDKSGLVPFVKELIGLGFEVISTGGTFKVLKEAGLNAKAVEDITGFPEIFEGRVKTLHPLIHGGLLGKRDSKIHKEQAESNGIDWIDLLVVNLYPFYETMTTPGATREQIIEKIDIGGPAMIRSAAKNHDFVTVLVSPSDYPAVLEELSLLGDTTIETRMKLAEKAFSLTSEYDSYISSYFRIEKYPEVLPLAYELQEVLRYGENPHQSGAFYRLKGDYPYSLASSKQLHGKQLSYNNIQDANAALMMLREFEQPTVVALKHMNPCGIASAASIDEAWVKAYKADPVSIFGGIIACNEPPTKEMAQSMSELFLEVILAPSFSEDVLAILSKKKNIRLLEFVSGGEKGSMQIVSVQGGILIQDVDRSLIGELSYPTKAKPTKEQLEQLLFAYKVVKHVKSNAIVIVRDHMTVGVGAGQMNRVGAAKIALEQAQELAKGAVMASDGFFPMNDTVTLAAEYGISAIIQPGGSIKDQDSIAVCDDRGLPMVFTGIRHFKH
ncbi:MAG: bifunctional phosphoribosylaminoimidazolecarboxamide formyltransferase/IMP cyclohydrolase [Candidatus Izemoplasmatales bacterium]|nr:bifunctional phosphoribosylaminoimidazolecarboxamide formyltransferase/IMP cyclohydrolase [Candidatus Izemoplasmatales bacterium]